MTNVATPVPASTAFRTDIQALRGLAIVLVVLYHAKLGFLTGGLPWRGHFFCRFRLPDHADCPAGHQPRNVQLCKILLPQGEAPLAGRLRGVCRHGASVAGVADHRRDARFRQTACRCDYVHREYRFVAAGRIFRKRGAPQAAPARLVVVHRGTVLPPASRRAGTHSTTVSGCLERFFCCLPAWPYVWFWPPIHPGATFYLLPTRGWELAIGSLGALVQAESRFRSMLARSFWPALLALLVVPFAPTGVPYPGLDAVIVCVATLAVILRGHPLMNDRLLPFAWRKWATFRIPCTSFIGRLFAFANNTYLTEVPAEIRAGLVVVSFVLGYLLYRFVELPMRRADIALSRKSVAAAVSASLFVIVLALGASKFSSNETDFAYIRRSNLGFGAACAFGGNFAPVAECRNSEAPRLLVWGDFVAMHLVPGLAADGSVGSSRPRWQFAGRSSAWLRLTRGIIPGRSPNTACNSISPSGLSGEGAVDRGGCVVQRVRAVPGQFGVGPRVPQVEQQNGRERAMRAARCDQGHAGNCAQDPLSRQTRRRGRAAAVLGFRYRRLPRAKGRREGDLGGRGEL